VAWPAAGALARSPAPALGSLIWQGRAGDGPGGSQGIGTGVRGTFPTAHGRQSRRLASDWASGTAG
jgi:hypothetical protein